MTNLHDVFLTDLTAVFMREDEFAQLIDFDGQPVVAIVDDSHSDANTSASGTFADAGSLGLIEAVRVVRMAVKDLPVLPVPDQEVFVDGERWIVVGDSNAVKIEEGMVAINLVRAYA